MAPGVNQNALALQIEKVRPEVPVLYQTDDTLYGLIEERSEGIEAVSSRAMRGPLELLAGGNFSQINPDGGNLFRGSAIKTDFFTLNQAYFAFGVEYTKLTEIATESKQKAVENYVSRQMERAMQQMRTAIEAVMQGDGSGTLDSIVSVANNPVISVNNANQFFDNQTVQVFPNLTSAARGSFQILGVDSIANTITIDPSSALPPLTAAGDLLIVNGSAGVANSSLNGIANLQLSSNVGNFLGIQRSAYPGRLSTTLVPGNNSAITPQRARVMIQDIRTALGAETPEVAKLIWHMNVDQEAAWENVGLIVSQVIQNQVSGKESVDMLKFNAPKTMAGRPIKVSIHALPGRIDGLSLSHWGRAQIQPLDYYEVNGQTLFPIYGNDGGISTSVILYLWVGFNIFVDNPRAGVYSTSNAIPAGYFGH